MRDDGARDRALRRYPAHVDLEVTGWWAPRDALVTGQDAWWRSRSRRWQAPAVRYHHRAWKQVLRDLLGTPVDHPARQQLVAEAHHLDDLPVGEAVAVAEVEDVVPTGIHCGECE